MKAAAKAKNNGKGNARPGQLELQRLGQRQVWREDMGGGAVSDKERGVTTDGRFLRRPDKLWM
jgi:hypothetical protein